MAVGFSGSNGGISPNRQRIALGDLRVAAGNQFQFPAKEVSYFLNNVCNLRCRHCYVGYERKDGGLENAEWFDVFEQCLDLGALTFGNVGKEPTLCWDKTLNVLQWFAERRAKIPQLRYGLVTNAIRLDEFRAAELALLRPDYLDISLDGVGETHDAIRGKGRYCQTMKNIAALPPELSEKVFISFTANESNVESLPELVREVSRLGVKNLLVSPYVARKNINQDESDSLLATDHRLVRMCIDLVEGRLVNLAEVENFNIYVKSDYTTRLSLMETLAKIGVINFDNLWEDDYGVIFTPYHFNSNSIYFSYLPFETTFRKAIRFSHDGYIGNCYDMFFREFTKRTVGNVLEMRLSDLYAKLEEDFYAEKEVVTKFWNRPASWSNLAFRTIGSCHVARE